MGKNLKFEHLLNNEVISATFEERTQHYLDQYIGTDHNRIVGMNFEDRTFYNNLAENMANKEMLNEIHLMLRALIKHAGAKET